MYQELTSIEEIELSERSSEKLCSDQNFNLKKHIYEYFFLILELFR